MGGFRSVQRLGKMSRAMEGQPCCAPKVRVDIVFDTICPWCFIGKRRFEHILRARPGPQVEIRWRPFLLNPEMPAGGLDRRLYLDRKFGGEKRVQRVFGAVQAAGLNVGIPFAFDRIERTPATVDSHRLIRFAAGRGLQDAAVDALFTAYFVDGEDIGDPDVLLAVADRIGVDRAAARSFLRSRADVSAVFTDSSRAHRLGVNGVPCFIFNEAYAVAGAQETEVLMRLFDLAAESVAALVPIGSFAGPCAEPVVGGAFTPLGPSIGSGLG